MFNKQGFAAVYYGLFVAATTVFDWYLNVRNRFLPYSEEESFRGQHFLERAKRVLAPPDLASGWWMLTIAAAGVFFLGFMSAKLVINIYQDRFVRGHNAYLKIIVMTAAVIGFYAGYILFMNSFLLPFVWKIHMSVAAAIVTFFGAYLVFSCPHRIYLSCKATARKW